MRLGYVGRSNAHPHSLQWWERNRQDPDTAIHLVRTWAWSPWLQEAQQRLGHALHQQTGVPDHLKEAVIVRVCSMVHSPYELFHHEPLALRSGLTEDELGLMGRPGGVEALPDELRAVVRFADEFDAGAGVQADTWDAVRSHLAPPQIVGLALQVGYWGCNARLAKALRLETESWITYERRTGPRPDTSPQASGDEAGPRTDPLGRLGAPRVEQLGEKSTRWLDRWTSGPDALVRTWSWLPDVQAAQQRLWETLSGDDVELDRSLRRLIAERIVHRRPNPVARALLQTGTSWPDLDDVRQQAVAGDPRARRGLEPSEQHVLDFVDAWETGAGVGEHTFANALDAVGRRPLVEAQLLAGFIGTQARLATALELTVDPSTG